MGPGPPLRNLRGLRRTETAGGLQGTRGHPPCSPGPWGLRCGPLSPRIKSQPVIFLMLSTNTGCPIVGVTAQPSPLTHPVQHLLATRSGVPEKGEGWHGLTGSLISALMNVAHW